MKYTEEIFNILSKGGFISANSVSPAIKRYYDAIEEDLTDYYEYYKGIGFYLEGGDGYYIMNGLYTILLLVLSNIFMTLAWYGHLKLQQTGVSSNWPLIGVIAFSWAIAFFEYCCQVPANRIGFVDNGGPFNLVQLKVIQECVSLIVFAIIANILFQGQGLHWNHFAAFCCLIAAVYFVFMK